VEKAPIAWEEARVIYETKNLPKCEKIMGKSTKIFE
jgi:hypothetical protein